MNNEFANNDSMHYQYISHQSASRHVTGEALYVDDIAMPKNALVGYPLVSIHAHAKILSIDTTKAISMPGVVDIILAKDIIGVNDISAIAHDEPLLAKDFVYTQGQIIALVLADSLEQARNAAFSIDVDYQILPAVTSIDTAIEQNMFLTNPHIIKRGDAKAVIDALELTLEGRIYTPAQDHFYLETQAALAIPNEGGSLHIYSSTQHPSEVQAKVAEVLSLNRNDITVEVPRMGGGFGGKETQGAHWAALAGIGAYKTRRAVKVVLNRDQDMISTGKRHPFIFDYHVGYNSFGKLLALYVKVYANGGWASDLSQAICDRAMFHISNCYYIEDIYIEGVVVKTNLPSNTAFRGFGGPQGVLCIEEIINKIAFSLNLDPIDVRMLNFYNTQSSENKTPYSQDVKDFRLGRISSELFALSDYKNWRQSVDSFNKENKLVKRGLGFQPVMFGVSFTATFLNQAGAYLVLFSDGSLQVNHGGTEMGQGLHTKITSICMNEFGISKDKIRVMQTNTDKVPNTSATAASTGSDLNGAAVLKGCKTLIHRLKATAADLLSIDINDNDTKNSYDEIKFENNYVFSSLNSDYKIPFEKVVFKAYMDRVSLSTSEFYSTPDIWYDRSIGKGMPFYYFSYGCALSEVEVCLLTGVHRLVRVDIIHDVGSSINKPIDKGQIEGAFIQGLGWLTREELIFSNDGVLLTHSPSTYKIPSCGDAPRNFNVKLLENASQDGVVYGSKAVGEPPFLLSISVVSAIRNALESAIQFEANANQSEGRDNFILDLTFPLTPESVLKSYYSILNQYPEIEN